MDNHIFVSLSTFAEHDRSPLDLLEKCGIPFSINRTGKRITPTGLLEAARKSTGIVAGVEEYSADTLSQLQSLRCISRCGVGLDSIDLAYASKNNIAIRNTPDVVIEPVTDLTIAMIYDALRKLTQHTTMLKAGRWEKLTGRNLSGQVVGIFGTGRIGRAVAQTLRKLGASVIAADPNADLTWATENSVRIVSSDDLIKQSNNISLHISGHSGTILGPPEFSLMKPHAIIVNTSRGSYVDEDALSTFLEANSFATACLDVFSKEPYTGKLQSLPNVIMTPHVATLTEESRTKMEFQAVENLISALVT